MAAKVEQEVSVPLPLTFAISRCERVTAAVGKCPVCGLKTAAWKTLTRLLCRVCFPSMRIRFTGLAGEERTDPTLSPALFYVGTRAERFEKAFAGRKTG
jgi:hypothetical protein